MSTNNLSLYPVVLGAGAVGTPSLYLSTDTTTGLYRPAANQIGVAVSGVARALFSSTGLALTGATFNLTRDGGQATLDATSYTAAAGSGTAIRMFHARGSLASPAVSQSADPIAIWSARAWTQGTTFTQCGLLRFLATETHSATAAGTQFQIATTPNGSLSPLPAFSIGQDKTCEIMGPLKHTGTTSGVNGATPVAKATITGDISSYNETTVKALLTALAAFGVILDSTTT